MQTPLPVIDNRLSVTTPEGTELRLRPASLYPRALAFAVDLGIRALILLLLAWPLLRMGQLGLGLGLLLLFVLTWGYMFLFEWLNQGRTPGKQLLGLRVVTDDGRLPDLGACLIRNLLRFIDMLPLGYALGLLISLSQSSCKRLGDIAAATLVVHDAPRQALPALAAAAEPTALSAAERAVLLDFAERAAQLSQARRLELLLPLAEPLGQTPEAVEARLLALAREPFVP